jgi:exonuclease III
VDVIAVQETHATSEDNLRRRGNMPGYLLIGGVHSNVHGFATYAKTSILTCRALFQDHSKDVYTLAVEVDGIVIVNVYKPPSANWSNDILKLFPHPTIYVGDFNSHYQLWGYEHIMTLLEIYYWSG